MSTPHSLEMQAYYAARAPYYDAVYLKPERVEDIAYLSAHLPARLSQRCVLEIACGTGFWTQFIARTAAALTATDATPETLALARERQGTELVAFSVQDAYALSPDLGTFDAAFAGLWLSHVPIQSRAVFFASLHARLAPGARVLMIDNNEVQLKDFAIVETDDHGNTYQHRQLRDGSTHKVLKNFPSEAQFHRMLKGFGRVTNYSNLSNFWLLEYEVNNAAV